MIPLLLLTLTGLGLLWLWGQSTPAQPPAQPPDDTEPEGTPYSPEENAAWEQHVARWRKP